MDTLLTQLPEELEYEIRQMVWHSQLNDCLRHLKVLNRDYYWDTDWERTYWKPKRIFRRMKILNDYWSLNKAKTIDDIEFLEIAGETLAWKEEYSDCMERLLHWFEFGTEW